MGISKFVEVFGSKMHYLEDGKGDPILFLHGVPLSSYVWRNILPILAEKGRCIAPDLIGMGESAKPAIQYTLDDHIKYIEGFIEELQLKNITLVLHGLGSAVGFDYAMRHENNVKGIAFYEAFLPDLANDTLSLLVQNISHVFKRNLQHAKKLVLEDNFLLTNLLPASTISKLAKESLHAYHQPFEDAEHRVPLWQYVKEFLLLDDGESAIDRVANYSQKLQRSNIPKLMLYANPGFLTPMATVKWCLDNLTNLDTADLEEGLHLEQEANPKLFGHILKDWYNKIVAI